MATRSLNKVQLIGNLTRDPELRYTPTGTAVCTLGLATNRAWKTEAGEKKEAAEFHRIVAWNKLAELCAQLLFKGRKVYVEGRLQTREWTTQDGTRRQTTEIVISDMLILDSRRREGVEVAPQEVQVGEASQPGAAPQPVTGQQATEEPAEEVKEKKEEAKEEKTESEKKPKKTSSQASTQKKASDRKVAAEEGSEEKKQEVKVEDIPF